MIDYKDWLARILMLLHSRAPLFRPGFGDLRVRHHDGHEPGIIWAGVKELTCGHGDAPARERKLLLRDLIQVTITGISSLWLRV